MIIGIVRLAVFLVTVALIVTPFDFAVLFGGGEASHWLRSGITAGALGALFASGNWLERLVKPKPVEKPE